jgi:UDP-2-acetamido-3-amino-2,3-dideoxy-glucuronate N-acetyltransferase
VVVGDGGMAAFDDGQPWESKLLLYLHRGAWISGADAPTPTPVWAHAMRTDSGRPSSSIRFRAWTAMATSVA